MFAATILAFMSAVLWAFANVAIQRSSQQHGAFGALLWAQLVGGALVICAAWWTSGPPPAVTGRPLWAVLFGGLCAVVAYTGLFESLRRAAVALVSPIIAAWSVVSVLVAIVAFGESPSSFALLGVGCVVLGNMTLVRSTLQSPARPASTVAIWAAVASALGFGFMVPAIDVAGAAVGRLWVIPMVWGVEIAIGLPLLILLKRVPACPRTRSGWWVAGRAGVLEVAGFVAMSLALAVGDVSLVSPVSSLSTACSVLLGVVLLRERLPSRGLLGAALASVGVILVNL